MKMKPTSRGANMSPFGSLVWPLVSMPGPTYDKRAFCGDVTVFNVTDVEVFFENFEFLRFTDHNT